jgi:PTH1 family peptidyl-tRNA hydrolase
VTRLVVGLGNPGQEYEGTRHNVGFAVLDRVAKETGTLFASARRLEGYRGPRGFAWARPSSLDAFLLEPQTFMNLSGTVVAPVAAFLGGELGFDGKDLMVVYDDIDLPLGKLRIRPHGGAGGHNGMRSIIEHLGTDRFARLRVGIGRQGTDAARHVLSPFLPEEAEEIAISCTEAGEAILDWLRTGDLEGCMTRYHSRWNQEP